MSPPVLYVVRHGETDWNVAARLQGHTDTDLNAIGRAQAEEVGRRLRELVPALDEADFVSSPLRRALDTMDLLRQTAGLPAGGYRCDPAFIEVGFGSWEGESWKGLRRTKPDLYRERERCRWTFTPPGGESYATVSARVAAGLDRLARDTVLVSHGGVARAVLTLRAAMGRSEALRQTIWQGRVLVLEGGRHRWV